MRRWDPIFSSIYLPWPGWCEGAQGNRTLTLIHPPGGPQSLPTGRRREKLITHMYRHTLYIKAHFNCLWANKTVTYSYSQCQFDSIRSWWLNVRGLLLIFKPRWGDLKVLHLRDISPPRTGVKGRDQCSK